MKLHIGCGPDKKKGYVNVDIDTSVKPDVVDNAFILGKFKPRSVELIESYHLFEHLTYNEAISALNRWYSLLIVGGRLIMELPDFYRCIELLLKEGAGIVDKNLYDSKGVNLAMGGIYGYPPMIDPKNHFQVHKWGWTPSTITATLKSVGFKEVSISEPTQTWRVANKINRDMRVSAIKGS